MTNDKLADEIERLNRTWRDDAIQAIERSVAEWRQIIAALRCSEPERSTCPLCKGTGQRDVVSFVDPTKTIKNSCSVCKGSGILTSERQPSSDKVLVPESALHAVWLRHPLAIAELCDEHVDRSGVLLGRVRLAATKADSRKPCPLCGSSEPHSHTSGPMGMS